MVRQFIINLNREEGYAQREARKRRVREQITLLIVTLVMFVITFITFQNDREIRGILEAKQNQLKRIIAQIDSLQKEGQNVSKEDVLALARLDRERVFWTKKWRAVSERMPEDMAITGLRLEKGKFLINAISQIKKDEKEFDKVKLFMDRLRSTPMFFEDIREMKFTESKRDTQDDQDILFFSITSDVRSTGEAAPSAPVGRTSASRSRSAAALKEAN